MWMNQKTVFPPGTQAPASLKETDVDRQEEERGGTERMQCLGHKWRGNKAVSARGRQGIECWGDAVNGERDTSRGGECGSDGVCVSWWWGIVHRQCSWWLGRVLSCEEKCVWWQVHCYVPGLCRCGMGVMLMWEVAQPWCKGREHEKSLHEQKPGESSASAILPLYQALDVVWRP